MLVFVVLVAQGTAYLVPTLDRGELCQQLDRLASTLMLQLQP